MNDLSHVSGLLAQAISSAPATAAALTEAAEHADSLLKLGINLAYLVSAALFIFGKFMTVSVATYMFGYKTKDSFVISISLLAMGEFAFIISKIALDAGLLSQELYSSVIGAALITMVTLPLTSKFQGQMFTGIVRAMPGKVRSALARMDSVKEAATARNVMMSEDRRKLASHLTRIFVDYLYIVLILLVFNLVSGLGEAVRDAAGVLGVLPEAALLFIMLLAISPAVVSIFLHLRRLSTTLTDMAIRSKRIAEGSRGNVYRMFIDLNEIVMFVLVLALITPFVPSGLVTTPLVFLVIVVAVGVVAILAWDALRNSYVRFMEMVAGNGRRDGPDQ